MGKPSIFSKNYEKKIKKRRIKIIITITISIIVICGVWFLVKGNLKSWVSDIKKEFKADQQIEKDDLSKNSITPNKDKNTKLKIDNEEKDKKSYEVKLSTGKIVKVIYEGEDKDKKFKDIESKDKTIWYDISPSGKNAIVFDKNDQKIICVNIDGNISDISKEKYAPTSGENVIEREKQLQSNPKYVWSAMPRFLDDSTVVYVSQLPWLMKTNKYLWLVNIENNKHVSINDISGQQIQMKKLTEKGLNIVLDGKNIYLKPNGEVVK